MTDRRGALSDDRADHRQALASILARGYIRFLSTRRGPHNCLAEPGEAEAPCDPPVNGTENPEPEEIA